MIKRYTSLLVMIVLNCELYAQAGQWTWMRGDSTFNSTGDYGLLGYPAITNKPPAMYGPASWKDDDGNFWVYGGGFYCCDSYSALWKYEPLLNEWTWVQGPNTANHPAVYGTIGIPSPTNTPGARAFGVLTWNDNDGNLWLYGGGSPSPASDYADLWRYSIATNEWTCMGIFDPLNYGIIQEFFPTNAPGTRRENTAGWKDANGNFWFFGGVGEGNITYGDVWEYDVSINQWAWMSGKPFAGYYDSAVYGIQGIPDSANTPGARNPYCHWTDDNFNFFLYGGGNSNLGTYGDLWRYDPIINQWAWMSGDSFNFGSSGIYTSLCDTSFDARPPASYENRVGQTDLSGNFWMMVKDYNDLWVYIPDQSRWVWVSGDHTYLSNGLYGIQTTSGVANRPRARFGATSWMDNDCNLWIFAGAYNYPYRLNDLWKFSIDTSCLHTNACQPPVIPSPGFAATNTTICEKFCVDFTNQSTNNPTAWQWFFPGGEPSSSTDENPSQICYQIPGTYDVTLITTNANGNDTLTLSDYITVYPTPSVPIITQAGYTLTSSAATSYQWQFNTIDIPGATNQSYDVQQSGYYTVIISDEHDCISSSSKYVLIVGVGEMNADKTVLIYPNPSSGNFTVEVLNSHFSEFSVEIENMMGQIVTTKNPAPGYQDQKVKFDLTELPAGVYIVAIKGEDIFTRQFLVIER